MSRLRQLDQIRGGWVPVSDPVKPEIFAEDLLLPIGSFGRDNDGVAIGRNRYSIEADRVEEIVDCELGLSRLGPSRDRIRKDRSADDRQ